jgi:hypothetical protein
MGTINASGTIYLRDNAGTIEYANNPGFNNFIQLTAWPYTVINIDTLQFLKLIFTTNITFSNDITKYFVCGSDKIQFGSESLTSDGSRPNIIIQDTPNYLGFIQNTSYSYINIFNLVIYSIGSTTLIDGGGWVGQNGFAGANNWIVNCSSNGDISNEGGGIVGSLSAAISPTDSLYVYGCSSSGVIGALGLGEGAGGIIGYGSAYGGTIYLSNCSSSGLIVKGAGIISNGCGVAGGSCQISKCYSTGTISGDGTAGICGTLCGAFGSVVISQCYSNGGIVGPNASGIVGQPDQFSTISVVDSYSTGAITGLNSGGIFAIAILTTTATNCYTSGALNGGGGGIYGQYPNDDNAYGSNNYSEALNGNSGTWDDTNATTTLGITNWVSESIDTPFILKSILFTPYSYNNILETPSPYTFNPGSSETVNPGDSTVAAVLDSGYTYTIVQVNGSRYSNFSSIFIMNSSTGQIAVAANTTPGIYNLLIKNSINPYGVSEFQLTVLGQIPPTPGSSIDIIAPSPLCCQYVNCVRDSPPTNKSNEHHSTYITGKTIIGNVDRYYNAIQDGTRTYFAEPVFKSYREYMIYLQTKNTKR